MKFRTDLAKEASENIKDCSGVKSTDFEKYGIKGSRVQVLNEKGENETGKKKGTYVSFESNALLSRDVEEYENISKALSEEIMGFLSNIKKEDTVLVAGLGNREMTPDSIGPKTVSNVLVTRHIYEFMPQAIDERMGCVCALAPGVLGVTGIESGDIIAGICKRENVKAAIVIDALAARRSERIFSTFQITDGGIEPGAGVGNKRKGINKDTLNIPVVAIGVPTVIYASSLAFDAADKLMHSMGVKGEYECEASDIIDESIQELVVTPKEIDSLASDSAKIIGDAINLALHKEISLKEVAEYMF